MVRLLLLTEQCDGSYAVAFASKLAGHRIASVTPPWVSSLPMKKIAIA